jgi:hypothetical protein
MSLALIQPLDRDLGGLTVRRLLPAAARRTVGPFIFFDHMGPVSLPPGEGIDVRPHPHIGLATVTWLFEGELVHRDSLGSVQTIVPGEVNWMTAGRGIVHSERSPDAARAAGARLHGIQTWIALPRADESAPPGFVHLGADALPRPSRRGVDITVIAGHAFGARAPTPTFSDTLYCALRFSPGASLMLTAEHAERALYAVDAPLLIDGEPLATHHMAVLEAGAVLRVDAPEGGRAMLCGGAPLDGERFIWWNFVAGTREAIDDAKQRWREQRFDPVPGETEFVPLPG